MWLRGAEKDRSGCSGLKIFCMRPPHARSRPFCYRSIPAHAQTTRNYLVYMLSSLDLRCAGVRQGVRAIHPSIWGPKKHLQMRRTHEVGSRWICILAPARLATFFGMGMDISERPYIAAWVFSFIWEGPLQFAPANCSPRSWPSYATERGKL